MLARATKRLLAVQRVSGGWGVSSHHHLENPRALASEPLAPIFRANSINWSVARPISVSITFMSAEKRLRMRPGETRHFDDQTAVRPAHIPPALSSHGG